MGRNGFLIMIHTIINLGFFLQLKLILITGLHSIQLPAHCVQSFLSPVWISVWDSLLSPEAVSGDLSRVFILGPGLYQLTELHCFHFCLFHHQHQSQQTSIQNVHSLHT